MYKVIKLFTDLKDNSHLYNVGDYYPREGLKVSEDRIKELSGKNNKQKTPLIEKVVEEVVEPQEEIEETAEAEKPKKKLKKK